MEVTATQQARHYVRASLELELERQTIDDVAVGLTCKEGGRKDAACGLRQLTNALISILLFVVPRTLGVTKSLAHISISADDDGSEI